MKFEHQIAIEAARNKVWAVLSDFPQAASLMPDVSEVRELEDGSYEGTMRVRVGPIGLNLTGTIEIEQDETQGRWNMRVKARDKRVGGGVQASIEITLIERDEDKSELSVKTDVQFIGRLGDLGQPLIKRKADSTIQKFAENLRLAVSGGKHQA